MRTVLLSGLMISSLLFSTPILAAAKLGKVDIQKILFGINEGKRVRTKLKKKFETKNKQVEKEQKVIVKMQQDFQKQSSILNDKAKQKKYKEIQDRMIKLQQNKMQWEKELQTEDNKMKKPILERVRKIIEGISKTGNYDLVFEVSTAPVYFKEVSDITAEVVKGYNKKHK
jgi:outer membrane protein